MAQASFCVNQVRLIDKGEYVVIEGKRECQHGHVIDHVLLSVPAEIKGLFRALDEEDESAKSASSQEQPPSQEPPPEPNSPAVVNRLEKYFRNN
jgi:hypothetical protein